MNACSSPSVQGPGFLLATARGVSTHVSLPAVKAIFPGRAAGRSRSIETRLSETWSCRRLAVGVRSRLTLRQRNCSRLWCLSSCSSTRASLGQAVAFWEGTDLRLAPGKPAAAALASLGAEGALRVSSVWFLFYLLSCRCGIFLFHF